MNALTDPGAPGSLLVLALALPALVAVGLLAHRAVRPDTHRARVPLLAALTTGLSTAALLSAAPTTSDGAASLTHRFTALTPLTLDLGPYAAVLAPLVTAVATACLVVASLRRELCSVRFAVLMLGFVLAALVTVLAGDLVTLLIAWELMGAASWALVGFRWADTETSEATEAAEAARTAFLTTRAADLGLYVAVGAALAGGVAGLRLDELATASTGWRHVVAAGVLLAALGKAAQLPFSFWLRRAMAGPAPVSALLHSAAMVALGTYLLLRTAPLLEAVGWAAPVTAWVGAATAVVMGAVAVTQTDLKQLLAASTTAQLGFVVLAAGVGATGAGTAHLVAHAATKATLFLLAGLWLWQVGSRELADLRGVLRRSPLVGRVALVALLALGGVPPLSLWWTKDSVLATAAEASPALHVAGLLGAALAAAYVARVLGVVLQGPEAPDLHPQHRAAWALWPLALVSGTAGVLVLPLVSRVLPGEPPVTPTPGELGVSGVLVLAVGVVVLVREAVQGAGPLTSSSTRVWQGLHGWLGLERAAHAAVVRPTTALAQRLARVDDRVIAGVVDGSAAWTRQVASRTATGERRVARGVGLVAQASRTGSRLLRRPGRTGQLHHYYLAAVAGLGAVLLLVALLLLT